MEMRQNARDLVHAGAYLCCVGILLSSVAYAGASHIPVLGSSALLSWMTSSFDLVESEPTRVSIASKNAREIREALARPIAKPEPLQPITAKLAYGHLRPGGKGSVAAADFKPKLSKDAREAMAMDQQSGFNQFKASSVVAPELHKVY